jgi:hypothetical protein
MIQPNPKKLDFGLDWTKKIQSNNSTKIQIFWIFDIERPYKPKIQKKLTSL